MTEFRMYPWRTWAFAQRAAVISLACTVALAGLTFLHDCYIAWRGYNYIGTPGYYRSFVWVYLVSGGFAGVMVGSGIVKFKRRMCFQAPIVAATVVTFMLSFAFGLIYLLDALQFVRVEAVFPMLAISAVCMMFIRFAGAHPSPNGSI